MVSHFQQSKIKRARNKSRNGNATTDDEGFESPTSPTRET